HQICHSRPPSNPKKGSSLPPIQRQTPSSRFFDELDQSWLRYDWGRSNSGNRCNTLTIVADNICQGVRVTSAETESDLIILSQVNTVNGGLIQELHRNIGTDTDQRQRRVSDHSHSLGLVPRTILVP